jgi:hypothetical protein
MLAVSIGLLVATGRGVADPEDEAKARAAREGVVKMIEALATGDLAALKEGEAIARKAELLDIMSLLKPKLRGGLGTGGKHTPDGIEAWLIAYGRKGPTQAELETRAAELEKAAHAIQAIGMVSLDKPPIRVAEEAKQWVKWTEKMIVGGKELAAAAKARKAEDIKQIVSRINVSCNYCHFVERD